MSAQQMNTNPRSRGPIVTALVWFVVFGAIAVLAVVWIFQHALFDNLTLIVITAVTGGASLIGLGAAISFIRKYKNRS